MKKLDVYLHFNGTCEEALNFYKDCLGGEILSKQTFSDAKMPCSEEYASKIIHADFKSEDIYFMASDAMENQPVQPGSNITLSINLDNVEEQEELFNKLSAGGNITMPLGDTFWGAKFGMFTDKYGINWMLNCDFKK